MERNYTTRRLTTALLSLFVLVLTSSCTIYQNVPYEDDGIYSSERADRGSRVYIQDTEDFEEYDKNYFTKELERIDRIDGRDILTDIDTYSSFNDTIPDSTVVDIEPTGRAWGYNDSDDLVINVNLNNNWGPWGWGGWAWNDPFFNPWWGGGYWGGWGFNNWGWGLGWGWSRPGFGGWGWNQAWGWGWNRPFWGWNRPFWGGGFNNGWAYNNSNYYFGRRGAYNNTFGRRGSSLTRRNNIVSNRRANPNTVRRSSTVNRSRNSSNTSTRRRSSTIRRNTNSTSRRVNRSTPRRSNSRSINRSSSNRGRSMGRSSSGGSRSSGRGGGGSRGGRRGG